LVQKPDGEGRTNIGLIEGGLATNIVPARVVLHGEIRSHKPAFRRRQAHVWRKAFEKAAAKIKNNVGLTARIRFQRKAKYESYLLAKTAPSLREAEQALRLLGLAPCRSVSNGGLDVNWLHAHGIPAVSLGDGGGNPHDTKEYLRIRGYLTACRTAMLLIVGTETMRNLHQCP
jgi:tripeptide aminopeptidase